MSHLTSIWWSKSMQVFKIVSDEILDLYKIGKADIKEAASKVKAISQT